MLRTPNTEPLINEPFEFFMGAKLAPRMALLLTKWRREEETADWNTIFACNLTRTGTEAPPTTCEQSAPSTPHRFCYCRDMDVIDLAARVREVSPKTANALLTKGIPFIIPLASGMRVRVIEWTPERTTLSLPNIRRNRNHLRSIYFGAQMTLADLTVGVLLFQRFPIGPFGGVIKKVEAEFLAKAKGGIHCDCQLAQDTIATLEEVRTSASGKVEAWVPLQIRDMKGSVVTSVRFLVALKRFDRA